MKDGWTRYNSGDVLDTTITLELWTSNIKAWLSQANHIFSCLRISSNFEDYVIVYEIEFKFKIAATTVDPPDGYLFLCPKSDFKIGPSSFGWPNCPAYWSLDSSGAERLSMEDAVNLGFPPIHLTTEIWGYFWDHSVYTGLRQFHQAKGFDTDSQDVAQHLGELLYQLSKEMDVPFAHIDGHNSDTADDSSSVCSDNESEVAQSSDNEYSDMDVDEESEDRLDPAIADHIYNICTVPAERPLEDILNTHTMEQAPKCAAHEDDLMLRRLILDEKAQLIELHRLGIYTKEEVIVQLAKIEERYA